MTVILDYSEDRSVTKQCYHVSESVIKPKKTIKPLFPEYGCLLMSPAMFWSKSSQKFQNDPNIIRTIHKYQNKAIETSPSIKGKLCPMGSLSSFAVLLCSNMLLFCMKLGQSTPKVAVCMIQPENTVCFIETYT